jgi:hypothetical protein
VLKYVDNESDLITLSSSEDLILALDLSDKILRLVVENPSVVTSTTTASTALPTTYPASPPHVDPSLAFFGHHGFGGRGHHGGRGRWHHHGHGGGDFHGEHPHPHPHHHGGFHGSFGGGPGNCGGNGGFSYDEKKEKAKARIQSKLEFFKQSLDQMPPGDDWKRQGMLMKINRLEGRLLRWDAISDKKMCKRKQKEEKKWDKKLSPEALSQLQILKSQIATLKPVLYQLKVTKKAKKSELELALQTGQGDKENIWSEILRLKESIHETQKQISSFKEQIQAIRG